MEATCEFVSVGCNRTTESMDYANTGLVVYAASVSVALLYPIGGEGSGQVREMLIGHTDRVNCLRWCRSETSPAEPCDASFASGSSDKRIVVWCKKDGKFIQEAALTGHTDAVTAVEYRSWKNAQGKERRMIVSCSADSTSRVWVSEDGGEWAAKQTISFGRHFPLAVSLSTLPNSGIPVVAYGVDDMKVHLHYYDGAQFKASEKLQGHEDWVRCVAFATFHKEGSTELMLASGGQDFYVRLWLVTPLGAEVVVRDAFEAALAITESRFAVTTRDEFAAGTGCEAATRGFAVKFDSLLAGHENKVFSLNWHPLVDGVQPHCLLSTSLDKALLVWRPDVDTGIWMEDSRLGEVGGNTQGFYGGIFGPRGESILAHSFHGALYLWRRTGTGPDPQADADADPARTTWVPSVAASGHFAGVLDLAWDPSGSYLLSVSDDQTTRTYAPWAARGTWHEVSRPQVHGYDMTCVAALSPLVFASGADEKVVRVFQAPDTFVQSYANITGHSLEGQQGNGAPGASRKVVGASTPSLGLSNKAMFDGDSAVVQEVVDLSGEVMEDEFTNSFAPAVLTEPPLEGHLIQNTLWPEVQKLYGHCFELIAVAFNHEGSVLASSCKATDPEDAHILLWDTTTWLEMAQLPCHKLSVTQLAFSHNDEWLVKTWRLKEGTWTMAGVLKLDESVTAVSLAPTLGNGRYVLAVGLDNGAVAIYASTDGAAWSLVLQLDRALAHTATVRRVAWRPIPSTTTEGAAAAAATSLQLATCSLDNSVRLFKLTFKA